MARVARVMLVDSDEHMAQSLLTALSGEFDVTWTPDAFQALRWLGGGDWYDIILCELELPKMNGLELEAGLAVHDPHLAARIVFTTERLLEPEVQQLLAGVPNVVVAKPFDIDALRDLIRRRTAPYAWSPGAM